MNATMFETSTLEIHTMPKALLATTLAGEYRPGSNLKGEVAGANWLFLLPSLALETVLCLGIPSRASLRTLASFADRVLLLAGDAGGEERARQVVQALGMGNVQPLRLDGTGLPLADRSVDLLVMASAPVPAPPVDGPLAVELLRLLKPGGHIFQEHRGARPPSIRAAGLAAVTFWVTPVTGGEIHTAVPVEDPTTARYFLEHRLFSPLATVLVQGRKRALDGSKKAPGQGAGARPRGWKASLRSPAKRAVTGALQALERGEAGLSRPRALRRWLGRHATLLSAQPVDGPPRYLAQLAQEAGLSLEGFRWGLVARGDYSSRKLLFFLFEDEAGADGEPAYIVKMVRDPRFNPRLENEWQALEALARLDVLDPESYPRVAFAGHHAGLAMVGETNVAGAPFRERSQGTADCPHLHAAADWFTRLGAGTARLDGTNGQQTGAVLADLLARFQAIYRPDPALARFLEAQIRQLANADLPLPTVFQHGDPGTWNMRVTPSGKVALLDWEAAELQGMPLWDLFYFLRSYVVGAARKQGIAQRLEGFQRLFLAESPWSQAAVRFVDRYVQEVGVPREAVLPLFFTCWMHRSLKEANRLEPARLAQGHYVNLLRLCVEQQDSWTLQRLAQRTDEVSA